MLLLNLSGYGKNKNAEYFKAGEFPAVFVSVRAALRKVSVSWSSGAPAGRWHSAPSSLCRKGTVLARPLLV